MKRFTIIAFLLMLVLLNSTPSFADDYSDRLLEKKYRKALNIGCEDIRIKDPAKAAVLGLLPGGGSFYTRDVGLGITDLLLWPFSPIWDMPLANKRATRLNKQETVLSCEEKGHNLHSELTCK